MVTPALSTSSVLKGVEPSGLSSASLVVLEDEQRHLAGHLVHAGVGEVVAPGEGLAIEVEQVGEPATGPEAIAHEADRSLDAALLVAAASTLQAIDGEAARAARIRGSAVEHAWPRAVCESTTVFMLSKMSGRGDAAEEAERPLHAAQERAHRLAERELDVEQPRVARDAPRTR